MSVYLHECEEVSVWRFVCLMGGASWWKGENAHLGVWYPPISLAHQPYQEASRGPTERFRTPKECCTPLLAADTAIPLWEPGSKTEKQHL